MVAMAFARNSAIVLQLCSTALKLALYVLAHLVINIPHFCCDVPSQALFEPSKCKHYA